LIQEGLLRECPEVASAGMMHHLAIAWPLAIMPVIETLRSSLEHPLFKTISDDNQEKIPLCKRCILIFLLNLFF
jgi:hypothetical protein